MQMPTVFSMSHGDHFGHRILVVLLMAAAIAVSASGCGKSRRDLATVTGKVTYKGKPLQFGTVVFQPAAGQYATGAIQPDGTFQMTTRGEGNGCPVGKNAVRIACFAEQDPAAKPGELKVGPGFGEPSLGKPLIPRKYLSCETSGITVEVRSGANEPLVFSLVDD